MGRAKNSIPLYGCRIVRVFLRIRSYHTSKLNWNSHDCEYIEQFLCHIKSESTNKSLPYVSIGDRMAFLKNVNKVYITSLSYPSLSSNSSSHVTKP